MSLVSPSNPQDAATRFYEPIADDMAKVRDRLLAIVPADSFLLKETVQYTLTSSGKMLRPALILLLGLAISNQQKSQSSEVLRAHSVETAAVTEMIHVATLLHDDVLDEAATRRGKKTVRFQWGNTVSILSGDFLLAQASLKLAQIGVIRLVEIYAKVLADLCDGEVEQIRTSYCLDTPWESYFHKSICKTASLFSAGAEAIGVLYGLPEAEVQALRNFGKHFGIAFQIVDDLLDYTADAEAMGKPVLDDLQNGLVNAPVLLALEQADGAAVEGLRTQIEALFQLKSEGPPDSENAELAPLLLDIKDRLQALGALEQTVALAQTHIEEAKKALHEAIAPSPLRSLIEELTAFALNRQH